MSTNPLTAALRASLPPNVGDYLDAVLADLSAAHANALQVERDERGKTEARLNDAERRLTELEALLKAASRDDRYALTKAKLVRLMKDMGYL